MPQHFLNINDLSKDDIFSLLNKAQNFIDKKQHIKSTLSTLKDFTIANVFFEASTRTRCSFELASKRLGAEVINFDIANSSTIKGETFLDTIKCLEAMHINGLIIRHSEDDAIDRLAQCLKPSTHIINAGAGRVSHPSQAILDLLTIQQHKKNFAELRIAIVGDIIHSRVAQSNIAAFKKIGIKELRLVGPSNLLPQNRNDYSTFNNLEEGVSGVDVIMMLRLQKERMQIPFNINLQNYYENYCLTEEKLAAAKPDAIVLHPGPVNRDIEIAASVADSSRAVILQQIENGVAARMAILATIFH